MNLMPCAKIHQQVARRQRRQAANGTLVVCAVCGRAFSSDSTARKLSGWRLDAWCSATCRERGRA